MLGRDSHRGQPPIIDRCCGLEAAHQELTFDHRGGLHHRQAEQAWFDLVARCAEDVVAIGIFQQAHACLCLDELSQVEAKAAGHAAYMLANGVGKARAGREGQSRKAHEWRLIFLSSGEIGLADKIEEGGGRMAAGMEVRVIDLRADAGAGLGLFERIHDAADPATFAQNIKAASGRYYGAASREFIRALVPNLADWRAGIETLRKTFLEAAVPAGADGQVRRVADRFALVAAAGEVATSLGITGWPEGEALASVQRCWTDWLTERGGHGSSEVSDARARLRRIVEVDGHSRFLPWFHDPRTVIRTNTLGYVKRPVDDDASGVPEFYLHASPCL